MELEPSRRKSLADLTTSTCSLGSTHSSERAGEGDRRSRTAPRNSVLPLAPPGSRSSHFDPLRANPRFQKLVAKKSAGGSRPFSGASTRERTAPNRAPRRPRGGSRRRDIRPAERARCPGNGSGAELEDVAERLGELASRPPGSRIRALADHQQETAADTLAAAQRIVEVPLAAALDDRAALVGDAQPRKPLHEGMLERREVRQHRDDRVAERLREPSAWPWPGSSGP